MANMFTDLTSEGKRYFRELKKLENMEVAVGFQDGSSYENGATVMEVAAYNEFGSSDTPARPFMKQSFESHGDELQAACDEVNRTLANGGNTQQALEKLGVMAKGLIQEEIASGNFAPNAASTIAKKGSDKPLIDTGNMRQSVNYVVIRRQ